MRVALLSLLFVLACSRATIDRAEWQAMSRQDRVLYVRTLIAQEQSKDAKGGGGRRIAQSPDDYVTMIDAAYARGEQRMPGEIFSELR